MTIHNTLHIGLITATLAFGGAAHAEEALALKADDFRDTRTKILKNAPAICVPGFRVAFIVSDKAKAYAGSGLANVGGGSTVTQAKNVSMTVELAGVDPELMQRIADKAYEKFMAKLAESGRTIIPVDTVKAEAGFQKLELTKSEDGKPYGKNPNLKSDKRYVVVSPSALPLWFTHLDIAFGDKAAFSLGNWRALNKLSVDTKSVVVVPQITIDFAKLKSSGRTTLGSSASVEAEAEMALEEQTTTLLIFQAKMAMAGDIGSVALKESTPIPGVYGEMRSLDEKNDAGFQNSLTALTGVQGTQRFKSRKAVVADPVKFEAMASSGIDAVLGQFAQTIKDSK